MPASFTSRIEMKTIIFFLVFIAVTLVSSLEELHISITNDECGKFHDADWSETFYLKYSGSDVLQSNPCSLEFENEDNLEKVICVSVQSLSQDCSTTVEFHSSFVKRALEPEKKITCNDRTGTLDEWCSDEYIDTVFVVIKKPARFSSDRIWLKLYRKYFLTPTERFFRSGLNIFLVAISPTIFIMILICICCYFKNRHESRVILARRARFQATLESVTLQTGQSIGTTVQPAAGYQPVSQTGQHQSDLNLPEGYNIHQMQRYAPPDQGTEQTISYCRQSPSVSRSGSSSFPPHRQQQPSAPVLDPEEPPPAYESLLK